ncbi:MAG: fibrinogen-like YCDxxxxGGGW domain-containing protein [Actinomycetaceae bacterium]|nr:fibrinogen-like YCDxxxxGGGW domain-containing protein [Actinomycetaceae bacterium]
MSRPRPLIASLAALATAFVGLTMAPLSAQAQPVPVHDGLSPATAAASCWEIKKNDPSSPDGTYWLLTPQMDAPAQFFCDQSSDGGGWVLIGRGREGWDTYARGEGDPAALQTRVRGPEAFSTVQLSEETINALFGGTEVGQQPDPIRVVRAEDSAGQSWQTLNFTFPKMKGWEWPFRSYHSGNVQIDGGWWRSFPHVLLPLGEDRAWRGIDLSINATSKYRLGFAYGREAQGGSEDPNDFLYRNTGSILPYAEVYIRPQLTSDQGFAPIADSGTEEKLLPATVSDLATPTTWGVVGNLNGRTAEGNAQVQAFAQIGSTVFVGGNFTGVAQGAQASPVPRTALAAFDSTTGDFIPDFNATFNGQVKDLAALPDGNLLAAGEFTEVNGARHVGTVLLDPKTGATIESWNVDIVNRLASSGGFVSVRAIDIDGDMVYLGGSFTHLSGGGVSNVYARNAGRISVSGKPDRSWNPEFNGSLMEIDASVDSSRVYAAGFFTRTKTTDVAKAAVISTAAGADPALPFTYVGSMPQLRNIYQQTVLDTGSLVFFGGSQHALFGYEPATMQRVSGSIAENHGGDFQAMATDGQVLYAGCHCFDRAYENAFTYPEVTGFTRATRIQGLGAWDAKTGALLSWAPYRLRSPSAGAWELFVAEDGALWVGGDFMGSINADGRNQWNGGWARYGARDRVAPAPPEQGRALPAAQEGAIDLTWTASEGAERYQILRDDRVIAESTETTVQVPGDTSSRFFIRAIDKSGNIGASTSVIPVTEAPAGPLDLVGQSAFWSYYYADHAPSANWAQSTFDASSWQSGAAPIGYGAEGLETPVQRLDSRPVASYYRTTFDVSDPHSGGDIVVSYVADDGAAVYVNGVEVSRTRMSPGTITHQTRASAAIQTPAALAAPTEVVIPRQVLRTGTNVIAVESHLNYKNSRNMTFQATVIQKP